MQKILIHTNDHHLSLGAGLALKAQIEKRNLIITQDEPDIVIVIGGDGTMLSAIKKFRHLKVPYLGINTGHLGFLSSFSPNCIEYLLDDIMSGNYYAHKAPLLEAKIKYTDGRTVEKHAFNEFVIKNAHIKLFKCKISINKKFFNSYAGDGIVVSTPFGSTGYAIWCGGNAISGELQAIQLTPICPNDNAINYTLKTSIIMNVNSQIHIDIINPDKTEIITSGDSQCLIDRGIQSIDIKALKQSVELIFPKDYDYYQLYKNKIMDKMPMLDDYTRINAF